MKNSGWYRFAKIVLALGACLCVFIALMALLVYRPWLNDVEVVGWAHGIELPLSAKNIKTRGNWRKGFLDRWSLTLFEMQNSDVNSFLLEMVPQKRYGNPPENVKVDGNAFKNWSPEQEKSVYHCNSPVGDFLVITINVLDSDVVHVRMYTDWN